MAIATEIDLSKQPCNATAMRKASRRLTQLYDDALAPSGLRSTQYAILAQLDRTPGDAPTMTQLAEALVIDRSALGHNLRPLERDGFVALQEGDDRRRRYVVLTAAGKKKRRDAKRLWRAAQGHFEEIFGEREATRLRATLLRIAYDERLATISD